MLILFSILENVHDKYLHVLLADSAAVSEMHAYASYFTNEVEVACNCVVFHNAAVTV